MEAFVSGIAAAINNDVAVRHGGKGCKEEDLNAAICGSGDAMDEKVETADLKLEVFWDCVLDYLFFVIIKKKKKFSEFFVYKK